jgi:hypothetical protein
MHLLALAWAPLDHFKFKLKLFTATYRREIKFPKLSREAPTWPTLIEIGNEFYPQRAPKIRQTNVSANWSQLDGCVKRKRRSLRHEASEGVTVEMVSVRRIGGPIGIRVVRRHDFDQTPWFRYAMKFANE